MRAALLLPLLLAGCVAESAGNFENKDTHAEPWVGHWDEACTRHPEKAATAPLRRGRHMETQTLKLGAGVAVDLGGQAHVLVVVEGSGALAGAGWSHPLEPGNVALLPPGGATLLANEELRALLVSPVEATAGTAAPPRVFSVEELFPPRLTERRPGGLIELGRQPGLSLHAAAMTKLAGMARHAHLAHDEFLFFLSGTGTLGLGSEAGADSGSRGDTQLKRGYVSSAVSERALAFLPASAPHSYLNEGDTALVLQIFAPGFDGKDGFAPPDARKQPTAVLREN
ncbi:MAG: hypothetical protein AB7N76_14215 [Planctomycetota bacterium]